MLILLSPTKKQKLINDNSAVLKPFFHKEAQHIMSSLKKLSLDEIRNLFKVSDKIAKENLLRFKKWSLVLDNKNTTKALFSFVGEAFNNLDPMTLDNDSMNYINENLLIFSGLYGVLKPEDGIMLYRLDIADSLKVDEKSLYLFWKDKINIYLKSALEHKKSNLIINLASGEYTKKIDWDYIGAKVISPEFRIEKGGKLINVAIWSKKMRGLLARKLAENNVQDEDGLKNITLPGFQLEINDGKYFYIKREE